MTGRWVLALASASVFFCAFALGSARADEVESNTNRMGSDYDNFEMLPTIASFGPCQAKCEFDENCKAWTFVRSSKQNPKAHCWLKSSVPNAKKDNCCTSGIPVRIHGCEIGGVVRRDILDRDCQEAKSTGCIQRLLNDAQYRKCLRAQPIVGSGCMIGGVMRKDIADRDCSEARDTGCIKRLLTQQQYDDCKKAQKTAGGGGGGTGGGGTTTQVPADWNDMLAAHNEFRAQHCSPALQWDADLAKAAQAYAKTCPNAHGAPNENLAAAYRTQSQDGVTKDVLPGGTDRSAFDNTWSCEEPFYPYGSPKICPGFKKRCDEPKDECGGKQVTGHFTQVVWKSATKVGCGRQDNCDITGDDGKIHKGTKWVCRYDKGNTDSPDVLRQNVMPVGCTPVQGLRSLRIKHH